MAKINGNTIKPGMVLQHESGLWACVKAEAVKPGKGGAFAVVEFKNLIDGRKLNERFRSDDKVEQILLEQRDYQYLYEQDGALVFMDQDNFDQIELQKDWVGHDRAAFLQDGMVVKIQFHEERAIGVTLPDYVSVTIIEADVTLKGQTVTSTYKPAKADNGMRVLIPAYMEPGERVLISTETGDYLRRAD